MNKFNQESEPGKNKKTASTSLAYSSRHEPFLLQPGSTFSLSSTAINSLLPPPALPSYCDDWGEFESGGDKASLRPLTTERARDGDDRASS
ncbi:hypothetical protein Bca4012_093077 [Brassica carinata]